LRSHGSEVATLRGLWRYVWSWQRQRGRVVCWLRGSRWGEALADASETACVLKDVGSVFLRQENMATAIWFLAAGLGKSS
jgi:hypothetical protein